MSESPLASLDCSLTACAAVLVGAHMAHAQTFFGPESFKARLPSSAVVSDASGAYTIYFYDTERQSTMEVDSAFFTIGAFAGFHTSNDQYDYHVYFGGSPRSFCVSDGPSSTFVSFVCGRGSQATLVDSSTDGEACATLLTIATPAACGIDWAVGRELASASRTPSGSRTATRSATRSRTATRTRSATKTSTRTATATRQTYSATATRSATATSTELVPTFYGPTALKARLPTTIILPDPSGRYVLYMYDSNRQSLKDDVASSNTYRIGAYSGFHVSDGKYDYLQYTSGQALPFCVGTGLSSLFVSFVCGEGQAALQNSTTDSLACNTLLTIATSAACGIDWAVGRELASASNSPSRTRTATHTLSATTTSTRTATATRQTFSATATRSATATSTELVPTFYGPTALKDRLPTTIILPDPSGRYVLYMYDSNRQSLKDDAASSDTYRVGAYSGFHVSNGTYDYLQYTSGEALPFCLSTGLSSLFVAFVCGEGQAALQDSTTDNLACNTLLTIATSAACGIDWAVGRELASTSNSPSRTRTATHTLTRSVSATRSRTATRSSTATRTSTKSRVRPPA